MHGLPPAFAAIITFPVISTQRKRQSGQLGRYAWMSAQKPLAAAATPRGTCTTSTTQPAWWRWRRMN
jgi:hypothetical protein